MRTLIRYLSLLCVLTASLGFALAVVQAQDSDTPVATDEPAAMAENTAATEIVPTGDNSYCTVCHSQPLRTIRLDDGTLLNLFVSSEMVTASVHGPTEDQPGLGCIDCHGEDSFPHNSPVPTSGRAYTLENVNLCVGCHAEQDETHAMGLHAQAINDGNLEAAVCTDCHGAHHIQSAEFQPELVAGVCGDCHENTLAEWQISAHADIGPLGCASCHDHHAQTLRVGETTTDLCVNCHEDMPEVYAHETHLIGENTVMCEECHMYVPHNDDDIALTSMETTGHTMLLDSVPCTTCHEQLAESGEWSEIISTRFDIPAAPAEETIEEEAHSTAPASSGSNTYFIIQGLLVGLGLGLTFAIVFVTRANNTNPQEQSEE